MMLDDEAKEYSTHNIDPAWTVHDFLQIKQAACLLAGVDPVALIKVREGVTSLAPEYYVWYSALESALNNGLLEKYDDYIKVHEIKVWLSNKGIRTGFFFPEGIKVPAYLDPSHPHYAKKLAVSIKAWQAITELELKGKSPKKALENWLREHAAELGITDDAGIPIKQVIEDCAKIANWQPLGGAAKTPQS